MARIRTVKPELWTDETLAECSMTARLLFIASLNFADDNGNLDRSARQLKAQAFPYDDVECEPLVTELMRVGLFIEYEVADRKYLHIKGFLAHQKIDRPSKSRLPIFEESLRTRQPLDEPSTSPRPVRSLGIEPYVAARAISEDSNADIDPDQAREFVQRIKHAWPQGAARTDWMTAEKLARQVVKTGQASWDEILAGVLRYAACCNATGRIVQNPARWFGDIDNPWKQEWPIPEDPKVRDQRAKTDADWTKARERATRVGFRAPLPHETPASYLTAIQLSEDRGPPPKITELANQLRVGGK